MGFLSSGFKGGVSGMERLTRILLAVIVSSL